MAAVRFRAEGLVNVGIANLMADLGLTHGGFYTHFNSKEDLVAQACLYALQSMNAQWQTQLALSDDGKCLARLIDDYLTTAHRDFPDSGCVVAALAGELARHDKGSRQLFGEGISALLSTLQQASSRDVAAGNQRLSATACLALMVGALQLSRAVKDEDLSKRFLQEARSALLGLN
ncbi:TetR/AcrR family transcriptional regulator [Neisseriaceae bacterium TC5R-5]|nr:TetR/AcrR family transcriptional regulator [Neisseriaceae bacterium TC5R-5]